MIIRDFESADTLLRRAEVDALKKSNGVHISADEVSNWSLKDVKAQEKEMKGRILELEKEFGSTTIYKMDDTLNKKIGELGDFTARIMINEKIKESLEENAMLRLKKCSDILDFIKREIARAFGHGMQKANLMGKLEIRNRKKRINVLVDPTKTENQFLNLSSLSGGEKSKTLVFLIYAFYSFMGCPFRGLDEWDIFLDENARKQVENTLVEVCKKMERHQFFFITPLSSSYNTEEELHRNGRLIQVMTIQKNG